MPDVIGAIAQVHHMDPVVKGGQRRGSFAFLIRYGSIGTPGTIEYRMPDRIGAIAQMHQVQVAGQCTERWRSLT